MTDDDIVISDHPKQWVHQRKVRFVGRDIFVQGFSDAQNRELVVRVRAALAQLEPPVYAPTAAFNREVTLALPLHGYDLAVAVALLECLGVLSPMDLPGVVCVGELGIQGEIHPTSGVSCVLAHYRDFSSPDDGFDGFIVPQGTAREAGFAESRPGAWCRLAGHLREVIQYCRGGYALQVAEHTPFIEGPRLHANASVFERFAASVLLQIKRAIATGERRILFIRRPGSGVPVLAQHLSLYLEPWTARHAQQVQETWSRAGWLAKQGYVAQHPFRAPHHTVSEAALVGGLHDRVGVRSWRPGEVHLAALGVLFLDEIEEFRKATLDALWQELRSSEHAERLPRLVVAAASPCPCGLYGMRKCTCTDAQVARHRARVAKHTEGFFVIDTTQEDTK